MSEEPEKQEEDIYKSLLPDETAEKERRKKIMPLLVQEYLSPDAPTDIGYFVKKYNIPQASIYYTFKKEGVSRKDVTQRRSIALKEVRSAEVTALSDEAEKIATIAIGLGGVIARRYLDFVDYEMSHGKTLEFIAEDVMEWYEMKHKTLAEIDELKTNIEKLKNELSAAWAMNLPNFKYWLRTRILERYAQQVINARLMGVRLPVSNTMKAMQTDLLRLEGDINELFEGEVAVGIEHR